MEKTFIERYPNVTAFSDSYRLKQMTTQFDRCGVSTCRFCPFVDEQVIFSMDYGIPTLDITPEIGYVRQAAAIKDSRGYLIYLNPYFCPAMDKLIGDHFGIPTFDYSSMYRNKPATVAKTSNYKEYSFFLAKAEDYLANKPDRIFRMPSASHFIRRAIAYNSTMDNTMLYNYRRQISMD